MKKNTVANMKMVSLLSVCLGSVLFLTSCSDGDSQGLVAHWKFDEGKGDRLLDTSGHGNHGTIHGATWAKGRVGGGLQFDGVDDYVKVPKSASLNSITKEITLMCWIKTPLTGRHSIIERWPCDDSNQRCLELDVDSEGKCVHFALSPIGVVGTWHKRPETIQADKWVHIAATSDGKVMRIYVNSRPDTSASMPDTPRIHQSTANLHIGAWNTGNKWESFFKGSMDEIKIYSRALTHEEILEHYKKESPKGTVTGKVVDVKGKPIGAAKVKVGFYRITTDREGRYRISVPAGTYEVAVSAKGHKTGTKPNVKVNKSSTTEANVLLAEDKTPPAVSEVKVERSARTNAVILWKTDEASNSMVRYGTKAKAYKKTVKNPSYVKSHRVILTGLQAGAKYYFTVESRDAGENPAKSKEQTFSTRKAGHPFLIVQKSDYAKLRARAAKSPWKKMKADAISYVNSHSFNSQAGIRDKTGKMKSIVGAGALAYILDPANRISYKNKVRDTLMHWDAIYADRDHTVWHFEVPGGSALFNSILALDIIYDDLTSAERADIEAKLGRMAEWYWTVPAWHPLNRWGVCGVWALYRQDRERFNFCKSGYRSGLYKNVTPGGVFDSGGHYSVARFAGGRIAKAHFMDVLEFTGEDTYYSDTRFGRFQEWLYGAAIGPFFGYSSFGDTHLRGLFGGGSHITGGFRAHRFSAKVARNVAWVINGAAPATGLLNYLMLDQPLPAPKKPLSDIWDCYAAFWEDNPSDRSLMGAILSTTSSQWHTHRETNAVFLCAYGEYVLRNSGYVHHGKNYDYISNSAVSGNTVLIDGVDHVSKTGGGITEGFTAPRFDYARGYSGSALLNGKHWRNFCFVHPQDGCNGYWVLFDEVDADSAGAKANVLLHPNADNSTTVSDRLEYRAKVGPYTFSGHDVFLTVFLGTPPVSVNIRDGLFARGWDDFKGNFMGKYLYSTYETDGSGRRNIVTVLFPHDAKHAKAKMTRITGKDYTGAKVDLGNSVTDVAIESSGKKAVKCDKVSFRGLAALYRFKDKANAFYFVRKGRIFDDGAKPRQGFESDKNVTVYIKCDLGRIISPGAKVTFYCPGITGVLLDGRATPVLNSDHGWVKVAIGKGTHDLKFNMKQ
ncbi:MAG: carboxypeptidase regulatory-like domain-containing protein [Phycisphaerae bacterium]|nr:carboxypeptidase regulatory-like domain-containing protein [Phycisphaerae bacterium]